MDSLKDLGAQDVVTSFQEYIQQSMLEIANRPSLFPFSSNIRNEAYYAKQAEPIHDDFIRCPNCGHAVEAPGDQY